MFRPQRYDGESNNDPDGDFKEPVQPMVHAGAERGIRTMIARVMLA
jgi:hypothetical protein